MNWVFDASISAAWCFEDESTRQTDLLLDRLIGGDPAVVPSLWPLEIGNVLALAGRKRRISAAQTAQFAALLIRSPIHIDSAGLASIAHDVMPLADRYSLTVYDAAYLELAMRLAIPLATLDRALAKAARAAGVTLL